MLMSARARSAILAIAVGMALLPPSAIRAADYLLDASYAGTEGAPSGGYTGVFKSPRPSRTTVGVTKLAAPTAHVEITVTARK